MRIYTSHRIKKRNGDNRKRINDYLCKDEPNKYRTSTEQVRLLVFNLKNDESTLKEMMDSVGLKHRATFLKNYLYPAIDEGYVELLYPDQPNHPRQKYRLTEKALKWKKGE